MKTFKVVLTTHTEVLMEASDNSEAREIMACRCGREILAAEDYEISAEEIEVKPEDKHRVLRA